MQRRFGVHHRRGTRALSELIAAGDELYIAGYRFVVEVLPTFSA